LELSREPGALPGDGPVDLGHVFHAGRLWGAGASSIPGSFRWLHLGELRSSSP
jgi:hypothetical protein